jgi:hypothetical protein
MIQADRPGSGKIIVDMRFRLSTEPGPPKERLRSASFINATGGSQSKLAFSFESKWH